MSIFSSDPIWIPTKKPTSYVRILALQQDYNLNMMNVPDMWAKTKGKGIRVAVLDTGTPSHPDVPISFSASMVPDYNEDLNGHGTASASMIGARSANGMGLVGIAPECELCTCAVLSKDGSGKLPYVAAGIRWAVDNAKAHIINMSLGIPATPESKVLKDACEYAYRKGVTIVAAAGNESTAVCQPASYPYTIGVAAVDDHKQRANFSNYGTAVEFAAGGVDCYMAYLNKGYAKMSGTSFAAPAITGIIALIMADALNGANPRILTPEEVRTKLKKIAVDVGGAGWDPQTGYGIPVFGHSNTVELAGPAITVDEPSKGSCLSSIVRRFVTGGTKSKLAGSMESLGQELINAAKEIRG